MPEALSVMSCSAGVVALPVTAWVIVWVGVLGGGGICQGFAKAESAMLGVVKREGDLQRGVGGAVRTAEAGDGGLDAGCDGVGYGVEVDVARATAGGP